MNKLLSTAILLAGMALATNASAATFTSDHCGNGGCTGTGQPGGFATITATQQGAGTVQVTITPLNGNGLVGGVVSTGRRNTYLAQKR